MSDVVDFAKRRYDAANDCSEVSPLETLREVMRRIESGEAKPNSIIVVSFFLEEDASNWIETEHGGPATTNERLGMLMRSQQALMS